MTITNKNTNGTRSIPLGEREVMQELTPADPNYGKIVVGTNGTYGGEVRLAKDSDVASNTSAISDLDIRVDATESAIVALDGRLGTVETDLSTLTTTVDDIAVDVASISGRVDTVEDTLVASNVARADKYLSVQNIANMSYTDGNLTKIQYNTATDVNYETLTYTSGDLTSINHYVNSVLAGTTTLSYTSGSLISAVFVGV